MSVGAELYIEVLTAAAGGVGAVSRHGLSLVAGLRSHSVLLLINVVGSLLLGLVLGLIHADGSSNLALLAVAGFCGGFTTFSSFALQVREAHRQRSVRHAGLLVSAHLILCTAAAAIGWRLVT